MSVEPAAAYAGGSGLRIVVGDTCSASDDLVLGPGPLAGTYEACHTITAGDAQINAGAVFRAGEKVVLENLFSVGAGANFTAVLEASLGTVFAYVQDLSPVTEVAYNAAFYVRLDDLALAAGDELRHFDALAPAGERVFELLLKGGPAGQKSLTLAARVDGGGTVSLPEAQAIVLPAGWNLIELAWVANAGTGSLEISLNGGAPVALSNLSNGAQRIEAIRWGAIAGSIAATSGDLLLDEFSSWR